MNRNLTPVLSRLAWVWPVLMFAGLSPWFHLATPVLEATDEAQHIGVVLYMANHGRMPVAGRPDAGPAHQEATQPPLYYALGALLIRPFDVSDAGAFYRPDPASPVGRADLPGRRHRHLPPPPEIAAASEFPAAVRVLRVYSALLVAGAVAFTAAAVARAFPGRPGAGVWAGTMLAVNPMVLFIANSVNNDNLAMLLCAGFVYALARIGNRPVSVRQGFLFGVLAGLAALAKLSALVLVPAIAVHLLTRPGGWGSRLKVSGSAAAGFVVASGWWFVRNRILYGELTASAIHTAVAGNGRAVVEPFALVREWHGFIKSLWGVFGAFNIIYPDWTYHILYGLTAMLAGLAVWAVRRRRGSVPTTVCAVLVAANLLAVGWWTSHLLGSQGRLIFPCLPALLWLAAAGAGAAPPRMRMAAGALSAGFLAAIAVWAALVLIPAAYA